MNIDHTTGAYWHALNNLYDVAVNGVNRTGIGTTINLRRSILDMKKGELAKRMSTTTTRVSDLERGDRTPTMMELAGIALALGWTVNDLLHVACTLKGTAVQSHSISLSLLLKRD